MNYVSTRGQSMARPFCDILLEGLAPDGGLYMPEYYPEISELDMKLWRDLTYPELALVILSRFVSDIPLTDLRGIVYSTYTPDIFCYPRNSFDAKDITPLVSLGEKIYLQELSNGPTLAFKDVALQLLGNLFAYVLEKRDTVLNVLGATSGDTGSASEYAMRGKKRVRVFMLSPHGKGMTAFQKAQMYSLQDSNIFNLAINGVFDDAQDVVKKVSGDAEFKKRYNIGAVNSINWARIVAQVVYYFWGYFRATKDNHDLVTFAVPTGNFGNICAGHIARMMGLPIGRLVLATNENDVLDEYFRTGKYCPRTSERTFVTSSPSMDISKASNLERFVFDLVGRNHKVVNELWAEVEAGSGFDMSKTTYWKYFYRYGINSGDSSHADRLQMIKEVYQKHGLQIDPHTADALKVGMDYRRPNETLVVMETAQAVKFGEVIQEALSIDPKIPTGLSGLEKLPQRVTIINPDPAVVKRIISENAV